MIGFLIGFQTGFETVRQALLQRWAGIWMPLRCLRARVNQLYLPQGGDEVSLDARKTAVHYPSVRRLP